ncbi:hypothetical protein F5X68DRAFT_274608 [Plectosphaerella plurivora]|uniref:HTH APSES-type domain-containing protein n=1 Tax=Plectosphaerella plurivora TaxID=936078 RepID=A0A9P8VFK1_9PEZI|nr:hypothetical protein F5X68DRAFT_274608 [Plectosphaerella plurivora]
MVKAPEGPPQPGIYSATYSGIPVYEYQFGDDLKEHVMRRRQDDWINATHILKAAGFDKPARTRILEREVQKETHEKIQGGYGKYQGTWIPLDKGVHLAQRNNVYDRLLPIFEFVPGPQSPPPAPRHTSKPKAPKKPAVPKWPARGAAAAPSRAVANAAAMAAAALPPQGSQDDFDMVDSLMHDDDTPDNLTVASASYMGEEDRFDMSHHSVAGGQRKRKRDEIIQDMTHQQHSVYGDELLDYFLLSRNEKPAHRPEPPPNFQPNWIIDSEEHTALHWASAMGDVEVIKQLKRFGADLSVQNIRGESPLMRAVNFTNCYEKDTFPMVVRELAETASLRDLTGATVIHHAAIMKNGRVTSHKCARYYLDIILNKIQETAEPAFLQALIDAQDADGNTALHLAAERNARKCIRALLGRNASTNIPNQDGVRAEELIRDLNASKKDHRGPHRSSSPFAPESQRHISFRDALPDTASALAAAIGAGPTGLGGSMSFSSEAAKTVQTRILPIMLERLNELSQRYDDEIHAKNDAEKDARRILANTQAELALARQQAALHESRLEPEDTAARVASDANLAKHQVMSLITSQNRLHVQHQVDNDLALLNGDAADDTSHEERLALARQLQAALNDQRQAEAEYVDALSMVGTGENIDKYRRLLRRCLDTKDVDCLDSNLDSLIDMMEEDQDLGGPEADGLAPHEAMDVGLPLGA